MRNKQSALLLLLLAIPLLWLAFLAFQIYSYSHIQSNLPADAAVVLGAGISGNQPSPTFQERINHAIDLYQSKKVPFIIFTGGQGKGQQFTESDIAKAYAIQKGVPSENILCETKSRTTFENLVKVRKIIDDQGFRHILIVSDPLHMKRAMSMAEGLGIQASSSPTQTSPYKTIASRLKFLGREVIFLAGYKLGLYQ